MKLLSIDASGKTAACAVTDNGKVLSESFVNSGLTHSQTLLPTIDETLANSGITINDIDSFAITSGPGSFTGLRIGMALVMGLSENKPCIPIPTLTALAYNLIDRDGIIVPVMDARRNQVYTGIYRSQNGKLTQIMDDCAISVSELVANLEQYKNEKIWVLGDGAYLFKDTANYINFPEDEKLYILGRSIALAAEDFKAVKATELKINYLRLSQAERELKEKMKNEN